MITMEKEYKMESTKYQIVYADPLGILAIECIVVIKKTIIEK